MPDIRALAFAAKWVEMFPDHSPLGDDERRSSPEAVALDAVFRKFGTELKDETNLAINQLRATKLREAINERR